MTCSQCGASIADKALICYKCGAGTTPPRHGPAAVPSGRTWVRPVAVLVFVAAALALAWSAGLLGGG